MANIPEGLLRTMLTLAHRESRCDPTAVGPTDDWGLWQIHGPWVGALCRAQIACTRQELLNPQVNAYAAAYVLGVQGLSAWATYRG